MNDMPRYAILNNNLTKVRNVTNAPVTIAQNNVNWILCDTTVDIGDNYDQGTGLFSKPVPDAVKAKRAVKREVRELLRRTDWTQVPDNLGANKRDAWQVWRQALRALIAQANVDPFNIVFPEPPGDMDEDGL